MKTFAKFKFSFFPKMMENKTNNSLHLKNRDNYITNLIRLLRRVDE